MIKTRNKRRKDKLIKRILRRKTRKKGRVKKRGGKGRGAYEKQRRGLGSRKGRTKKQMEDARNRYFDNPTTRRQQFFKLWNQWVDSLAGPTLSGEKTRGGDEKYNESAWALSGYPWFWLGKPCSSGRNPSQSYLRSGFVQLMNKWINVGEGNLLEPIDIGNGHELFILDEEGGIEVFKVDDCWSKPWKRNDYGWMQGMYPHNIYENADYEHSRQQIRGFGFWVRLDLDEKAAWENYTALQQAYWQRTEMQPFQQPNNTIHRFSIGNGEFIEIQRNDSSYGADYDVWRPGERPDMSDDMETDDFFKMMATKILENEEKFQKPKVPQQKRRPKDAHKLGKNLSIHCGCGQRWEKNWLQCSKCGREWRDEGAPPFIQNKIKTEQKEQNRRRARRTKVRRKAVHWRPPRPTYEYSWRSRAQRAWDDAWADDDNFGPNKLNEEWKEARDFMKYNILRGNKIMTFEFPNGIKVHRDNFGYGPQAWSGPLNQWIPTHDGETFTQLLDNTLYSQGNPANIHLTVNWDKINQVREIIKQGEATQWNRRQRRVRHGGWKTHKVRKRS